MTFKEAYCHAGTDSVKMEAFYFVRTPPVLSWGQMHPGKQKR